MRDVLLGHIALTVREWFRVRWEDMAHPTHFLVAESVESLSTLQWTAVLLLVHCCPVERSGLPSPPHQTGETRTQIFPVVATILRQV